MNTEPAIALRAPTDDYKEFFGDWLLEFAWSHWLALTFRPFVPRAGSGLSVLRYEPRQPGSPLDYAHREWDGFVRRLSRSLGRRVLWFRGDEFGQRLGRLHLHGLVGAADGYPAAILEEHWDAGFSGLREYDPEQGAAHYIIKYVSKELADWAVSGRLVRGHGSL